MDGEYLKTKTLTMSDNDTPTTQADMPTTTPIDYKAEVLKVYPNAKVIKEGSKFVLVDYNAGILTPEAQWVDNGVWYSAYSALQSRREFIRQQELDKAERKRLYTLELVKAIVGDSKLGDVSDDDIDWAKYSENIIKVSMVIADECESQGLLGETSVSEKKKGLLV